MNGQYPYANRPTLEDIQAQIEAQKKALQDGRFLPQLTLQTPGLQYEAQTQRIEPVYEFRLFEPPQANTLYGIGVDPSEGLMYGDDSVIEVGNCSTGEQVAEIQGKIHPFDLAELVYQVGSWYNNALVGIENNRDGGCNAKLLELGYTNIYFLAEDKGAGYQKQMPKMGIAMSSKRRAELIAQGRRWLEEQRIKVLSSELLSQMEVFALHNGKFQAPKGAHDDLVLGFLIMMEMMRVQVEIEEVQEEGIRLMVDGEEQLDEFDMEKETPQIERMIQNAQKKAEELFEEEVPFMENMI